MNHFIQRPVPAHHFKGYKGTNPCEEITIHLTGNTSNGANAEMHARLLERGFTASWHITTDDKQSIQHYPFTAQLWHAGDGQGTGNLRSIGLEGCVNSDGDYNKMIANLARDTKAIMNHFNIPISKVKQHWHRSGKDCPREIRAKKNGISWDDFLDMVRKSDGKGGSIPTNLDKPSTSEKSISQMATEVIAKKHGDGHDNRRKSLGISASEYEKVRAEVNRRAGVGTSKPAAKPKPTKEYVQLPASAQTWRTYRTNVQPVAKNSDWSLTPAAFGGLEYEILARPQKDVVTINTGKGRRNIYIGSNTSARVIRK